MAIGTASGMVAIIESSKIERKERYHSFESQTGDVNTLTWFEKGFDLMLLSGSSDGTVAIHSMNECTTLQKIHFGDKIS